MARAIWTGSISFGLLNVPVKLYSAVSRKTSASASCARSDGSRVRHKRVAEADGEEVPYEDIVKGYELAPEQYVVLTRDELEELDPKKTKAIEIQDFVDLDEIDPIYFDQPYYLGPDKGAERAYALLVKAMADARKVAVARFVLRNRENLAAIRPMGKVLTMATMRFADEIVPPDELDDVVPEDGRKLDEARGRDGQAADRLAHRRLRPRQVPRRVPRGAAGADRAQGAGRGGRRGRLRGAEADQGARPDGRARGEPRRGQGRAAGRRREGGRREPSAAPAEAHLARQVRVALEVRIRLEDAPRASRRSRSKAKAAK